MSQQNDYPTTSQPNMNNGIKVDIEYRKMKLMFGERKDGQVVKLRGDGLRNRNTRIERELKGQKRVDNKNCDETPLSSAVEQNIEGNEGDSSTNRIREVVDEVANQRLSEGETNVDMKAIRMPKSAVRWQSILEKNSNAGNHEYRPRKPYHGAATMVEHKKRWTYRMACDITAAEQDGDGQMYYVADPFLPMPRSRFGASTAIRMNYAAQRLGNRKYRAQANIVKEIAERESASCDKCQMRFFLPSINMQQRISYLPPIMEEDLPTVLFECPVCKEFSKIDVIS